MNPPVGEATYQHNEINEKFSNSERKLDIPSVVRCVTWLTTLTMQSTRACDGTTYRGGAAAAAAR